MSRADTPALRSLRVWETVVKQNHESRAQWQLLSRDRQRPEARDPTESAEVGDGHTHEPRPWPEEQEVLCRQGASEVGRPRVKVSTWGNSAGTEWSRQRDSSP